MKKRVYGCLFLLVLVISCGDTQNQHYLNMAEACFYTAPDSAQAYLDSVVLSDAQPSESMARWTLLTARMHQKRNRSLRGDTLILKALEYYTATDNQAERGRASLYAGRVFEAREDWTLAKRYYDQAAAIGLSTQNYKLAGRSASELAEVYQGERDYEQAIKWFTYSGEWAQKANDLYYQINALRKRADCYVATEQIDKALLDYHKALNQIPQEKPNLRADIYKDRALTYLKIGRNKKAQQDMRRAMTVDENGKLKALYLLILAEIFEDLQQPDSANLYNYKAFLAAAQNRDTALISAAFGSLAPAEALRQPVKSYFEEYRWYASASDSIYEKERFNSLLTFDVNKQWEARTKSGEIAYLKHRNRLLTRALLAWLLLVALLFVGTKVIWNKARLLEMDKLLKKKDKALKNYEQSSVKQLKIYRKMIVLTLFPKSPKHDKLLADYNLIVHDSTDAFQFDWQVFEELVHSVYPEFKQQLLLRSKTLLPREIQVILLQKGGFTLQEIAELLHLSIHTVYRRNSEIRRKLSIPENQTVVTFLKQQPNFSQN
ncbi:tetratricopeptide repeat protein [Flavobacterium sp. JP2137]|uniref:tetratricopeptide repeat protein n=1 Tax=Flavobacterium sp. JP2137 TaxID=3414510 RepID=UPI003D300968